jgi:hypothetical protein
MSLWEFILQASQMAHLLAIELKKTRSDTDEGKAREYTNPPDGHRRFQYWYGLVITLSEVCRMTWYENGEIAS